MYQTTHCLRRIYLDEDIAHNQSVEMKNFHKLLWSSSHTLTTTSNWSNCHVLIFSLCTFINISVISRIFFLLFLHFWFFDSIIWWSFTFVTRTGIVSLGGLFILSIRCRVCIFLLLYSGSRDFLWRSWLNSICLKMVRNSKMNGESELIKFIHAWKYRSMIFMLRLTCLLLSVVVGPFSFWITTA